MNKNYPGGFFAMLCLVLSVNAYAQFDGQSKLVRDNYAFVPVQKNGSIEWDKFPEFKLPARFKIVYQGPRFTDDVSQKPLKHGFSHLATYNFPSDKTVPFEHRAGFSSGIPSNSGQPWWYPCLSPWGNDLGIIKQKVSEYTGWCDFFGECDKWHYRVPVDLFAHDFESNAADDQWIIYQRNLSIDCSPASVKGLTDVDYIRRYKKEMISLHAEILKHSKDWVLSPNTKQGFYGEAPLIHKFYDIADQPMEAYQSNIYTNYLLQEPTTLTYSEESPVMKTLDFVSPWVYYHYNYQEKGIVGQKGNWSYLFLPYFLFNVEGQRVFTKKPVIPFVQMRLQPAEGGDTDVYNKDINPEMAEATAVFSLLAGDGIWVWDQINTPIAQDPNSRRNFASYEYFVAGLYRMSRHNAMLESPDAYYAPMNSRDLAGTRKPVVRGVIKGKRILIAAQATDANPDELTKVPVEYKNWKDTLLLYGREVYIGEAQWTCEFPEINSKPIAVNDSPKNEGQTIRLNAVGGNNYTWKGPAEFISNVANPVITNPTIDYAGVYTVWARVTPACVSTATTEVRIQKSAVGCVTLNLKVLLEGPYDALAGKMKTQLNAQGLLPGQTPLNKFTIPTDPCQPFKGAPWNYLGAENVTKYDADVTDWVLITLRRDLLQNTTVYTGAGLVHADGTVSVNYSCVNLADGENVYAVIEHRNHIGVMSVNAIKVLNRRLDYDFTKGDSYRTQSPPSFGQKQIGSKWLMYGMDLYKFTSSQNYDINAYDFLIWKVENGLYGRYLRSDVNLDGESNANDVRFYRQNNGIYSKVPH